MNLTNKSIDTVPLDLCSGCMACYNKCPFNAIQIKQDHEGFWRPEIIKDKCTNCGLCKKCCPAEEVLSNNSKNPSCFACACSDPILREKSSSGGIFGLLANYVRENGGYVCGAAFNENMKLHHVVVSPDNSIEPLFGSKYLQSNIGDTFKTVKDLLQQNKLVLFCATPCQIAGLNKYLGNPYENLITIDLLCHGASSPKIFEKYLKETISTEKIVNYTFREKSLNEWGHSENIYTDSQHVIRRLKGATDYFRMFASCVTVMKACGTCKAATLPRQGDFTIGDAWGIDGISSKLNDGKGTSIVTLNNTKAEKLFDKLKNRLALNVSIPIEWVKTHGQPFIKPFKATTFHHDRFFELVKSNSFKRAAAYTSKGKFDVAITGVWYGANYGSVLTYYSMYHFISSLGLLTIMIDKNPINENDAEMNRNFHSRQFALKHYKDRISKPRLPKDMHELNKFADTFILGSDQVLHKNCLEFSQNTFLFNFVDDIKKKICYSSSFGHATDSNPVEKRAEIKRLLSRFDHIALREESGLNILQTNYQITNAQTVIDAIFLNDISFYQDIAAESNREESDDYILAYILDPNVEIKNLLQTISSNMKLKLINILDGRTWLFNQNQQKLELECQKDITTQDFVYYLLHAKLVITDSYHGTCFSILFKKQFITLANKIRGIARFQTILSLTNLTNRMIEDFNNNDALKLLNNTIDYTEVYNLIGPYIQSSRDWLKHALFAPKIIKNEAKYPIKVIDAFDSPNTYISKNTAIDEELLCEEKDIYKYLDRLKQKQKQYLILFSAKDTLGQALNSNIADKCESLGIKTNLKNKHWYSFISILDQGKNIFEICLKDTPVFTSQNIRDLNIHIESKPFKKGNLSRIQINGVEYSLNRRGLNIVVYDTISKAVIDTVSFDTHDQRILSKRVE